MSTSENHKTYRYRCPHGTDEYIDEWWIPDHGYSPQPYRKDTTCTCGDCERTYDADFDGDDVRLRERVEVERRRGADGARALAHDRVVAIERPLQELAVQRLTRVTGSARYDLAMQMLGFATRQEAMSFANRRRVPTWVPEGLKDRNRMARVAEYLGQSAAWQPLRDEYDRAKAARSAMGEAPICHRLYRTG